MDKPPRILNDQLLVLLIYRLISKHNIKINYSAKDTDILMHDQAVIDAIETEEKNLTKDEVEVLRAKFGLTKHGYTSKTYTEIASHFGMTHNDIRAIEEKGIEKLFTTKVKDILYGKLKKLNDAYERENLVSNTKK